MQQRQNQPGFSSLLLSTIIIVMVGAIVLVGFIVSSTSSETTANSSKRQVTASNTVPVVAPTTTAAKTLTSDPQPVSTPTGVTIITPGVAVGERIPLPLDGYGTGIIVRNTDATPLATLQEAKQALYDRKLDFALTGTYDGKPVTLTAVYGLVTIGSPGADGKSWLGLQNVPLPDGTTLSHIENRPMWVLDYGNISIPANGPACTTTPCPTPQIFNHAVYTFDGETKTLISADFYTR